MSQINHKNCFQFFLAASLATHVMVFGIFSSTPKNPGSTNKTLILELQLLPSIMERKVLTPSQRQEQFSVRPARKSVTQAINSPKEMPTLASEAPQLPSESETNAVGTPQLVASLPIATSEPTTNDSRRLDFYIQSLTEIIGRQRNYPRLARVRGWEGTVMLRLQLLPGGRLYEVAMAKSSGHDVLDQQALEMTRRLSSWPLPPDYLREREITVLVPVEFRLKK